MRPATDIPYGLHGRLKDYTEANDLTLDEAYLKVLETGLDTVETQNHQ